MTKCFNRVIGIGCSVERAVISQQAVCLHQVALDASQEKFTYLLETIDGVQPGVEATKCRRPSLAGHSAERQNGVNLEKSNKVRVAATAGCFQDGLQSWRSLRQKYSQPLCLPSSKLPVSHISVWQICLAKMNSISVRMTRT